MSLLVTKKREERWTLLSIKLVEGCLQTYNGCRRDVKQMLLPRDLSVKGVDQSYLCRKSCFASLDKNYKSREKYSRVDCGGEANKARFP